ncbi:class I SAM-dependent methyltransferase [Haloferax sp. S1W]|uniref:class I SAM-dependent methyltransferase n=1 Tax=Haloferax sp. S1W TaxID=3377110 RepID=UPI0037C63D5D
MSDKKRETATHFGHAAESYFESEVHRRGEDRKTLAEWCQGATRALDVATGAGHTAGAIAEAGVPDVVASDASPEMVATAIREYPVSGIVADAERLPFSDAAFDAVACRVAAHHFPDPEAFVAEGARVLESGGVLAFEDNVAPEDAALADFLNGVERLRDPTHVELYTVSQWRDWFESVGLTIEAVETAKLTLEFDAWTERTGVSPDDRAELEHRFRDASDEAKDLFEVEFDEGSHERQRVGSRRGSERSERTRRESVVSFANPKALIRARKS